MGISNYKNEKQTDYFFKTNHLLETIGSSLLVKAANNFNVLDLDFAKDEKVT